MPRKSNLSEQLGLRKQSGPLPVPVPVESRDTLKEVEQALGVVPAAPPVSAAPKRARTHARAPEGGITIDDLYRRIMQKKHLSSYTLRFQAGELDDLDAVAKEIEAKANGMLSKNDIARAALIWLLEDYHARGEQSILEQLVNRG